MVSSQKKLEPTFSPAPPRHPSTLGRPRLRHSRHRAGTQGSGRASLAVGVPRGTAHIGALPRALQWKEDGRSDLVALQPPETCDPSLEFWPYGDYDEDEADPEYSDDEGEQD